MGKNLNDKHFLNIKMNFDPSSYKETARDGCSPTSTYIYIIFKMQAITQITEFVEKCTFIYNYVLS